MHLSCSRSLIYLITRHVGATKQVLNMFEGQLVIEYYFNIFLNFNFLVFLTMIKEVLLMIENISGFVFTF